jgi:cytochrome P450
MSVQADDPVLVPGPPPPKPLRGREAKVPRTEFLRTLPLEMYEKPFHVQKSIIGDALIVNDPEGVKRVLLDNVANYPKTALEKRFFSMMFGNGLLSSDGETWRAHRRAMAPAFDPRSVASYGPTMAAAGQAFLQAHWDRLADGAQVDVADDMLQVTLQIISRTMFSTDSDEIVEEVSHAMQAAMMVRPNLFEMLPVVGEFFLRAHEKQVAATFERLDALVARFIAEREAAMKGGAAPNDLLGRLIAAKDAETGIGMTAREVRDQMLTIFLAGHETTAATLTWCFYVLSQRPEEAGRLYEEVDRVLQGRVPLIEDVAALPYVRAFVDETLRLYPAAPGLSTRQAQADDEICGRKVKKGSYIVVFPWILNRHRLLWDDPERFDPNRFLPGANRERHRFAYIPFAAGPRICIGMQMALAESVLLLAALVQRHRLELAPGQTVRLRHQITLRPDGGLRMILRKRAPEQRAVA